MTHGREFMLEKPMLKKKTFRISVTLRGVRATIVAMKKQ